jgi:hypothetical protein
LGFNSARRAVSIAAGADDSPDDSSTSPPLSGSKIPRVDQSTEALLLAQTAKFLGVADGNQANKAAVASDQFPHLGSFIASHNSVAEWFSMLDKAHFKYLDPSASKIIIHLILTKLIDSGRLKGETSASAMDVEDGLSSSASSQGNAPFSPPASTTGGSSVHSEDMLPLSLTDAVAQVCADIGIGPKPITRVLRRFLQTGDIVHSSTFVQNEIVDRVPIMRSSGSSFTRAHLIESLSFVLARLDGSLEATSGPRHVDYNMVVAHLKGSGRVHPLFQGDDGLDMCPPVMFHKNVVTHFLSAYGGIGWGKVSVPSCAAPYSSAYVACASPHANNHESLYPLLMHILGGAERRWWCDTGED